MENVLSWRCKFKSYRRVKTSCDAKFLMKANGDWIINFEKFNNNGLMMLERIGKRDLDMAI